MTAKLSAGLLMYRRREGELEVLLVHPGGPFWARKDAGAWMIPKGEYQPEESPLDAARREFTEETGFLSAGPFADLGSLKQAGGKLVSVWAFEGDCDPAKLKSNTCQIEWPPRSGRPMEIPEIDRGGWFAMTEARGKILKSQEPFLDRLLSSLRVACEGDGIVKQRWRWLGWRWPFRLLKIAHPDADEAEELCRA